MIMIDKLAYSSPWRYKSVYMKSALASGNLLICVAVRSFTVSIITLAVMGYLTVRYSQASLSRYVRMMMWPSAFLIMGTIAVLFDISARPDGILNIPLGGSFAVITSYSLVYALRLILVSLASVACLYFLVLTTPVPELTGLLKRLHCPWLIIELMTMIYRFIFVLLDSALTITKAQRCRLGNRDFRTSVRSMGTMLAALLVQSLHRASLLYDAMESRCFDGKILLISESRGGEKGDAAAVALYLALMLAIGVACWKKGGL